MWKIFSKICLTSLVYVCLQANALVVDLGYAIYESDLSLLPGVTSFSGVRYAQAPIGRLRWAKPELPKHVAGVVQKAETQPRQCFHEFLMGAMGAAVKNRQIEWGNAAPGASVDSFLDMNVQRAVGAQMPVVLNSTLDSPTTSTTQGTPTTDGISDEDCLFLNVHVPSSPPKNGSLLPVIVYIHGGGYDAGNVSLYPVHDFVRAAGFGVVAVNMQYRLGVFGFLAGQKVKDGGALNAGLLDQNFALQWVQKHISAFGGDPRKVTIWGQSAGGGAVLQHVVAHKGNTEPPLFRVAMMNSPFLPLQHAFNDPVPEALYDEVVSQAGCSHSRDTLACLRSVPATTLLQIDSAIGQASFLGTYAFVPVVDGSFIAERPSKTLRRGSVNGEAVLVTSNTDEGVLFVPPNVIEANQFTLAEYVTQLLPRLNPEQVEDVVNKYERVAGSVPAQAAAVYGDVIFTCPAYMVAEAFGSTGFKALFAIPPGTHAQDLSYEFKDFGLPPTYHNEDFFKAYQQSFMSMAMYMTPNDPTNIVRPEWPAWAGRREEMLFNKTDDEVPVVKVIQTEEYMGTLCSLWESLADVNAQ
ncbi:alpha/beta-hydrolase [Agrocybe pediades]|nr:alpha/beta-hydrolase [Agrocybe pediades]